MADLWQQVGGVDSGIAEGYAESGEAEVLLASGRASSSWYSRCIRLA